MTGQTYGTAKRGGARIEDQGKRVLQTRVENGELPKRLNTRKADVDKPLLAVCDLVDNNHAVLFDSSGSYAINKKTGAKTRFARSGRGWDLKLTLEAPEKANEVMKEVLAELQEARARDSQPSVELRVGAGSDLEIVDAGSPAFSREEPLFRLAVRRH